MSQVKYCNVNSIEFLAINRHHGIPQSLGSFNGIQINMASLQRIRIQPSGKSAWFQGGTYDGQVTRYLWDRGYVTTTGSCDCVGMMGPGLGGGHGRQECLYGMVSDNIIQLNVVLANGNAVRVNKTSYSDLLWAMKGAGHNFGIVTSFELHIFPRGPETWHYHNYIWRGDKLEAVLNTLNNLHGNGSTPVDMAINFGNFLMNTTITDKEPVIFWTFAYRGSAEAAQKHLAPFNEIRSVYEESGDLPYPEISVAQATDENSFMCRHGYTRVTATAGLQVYNVTAKRQIFDGFTRRAVSNANLAAGPSCSMKVTPPRPCKPRTPTSLPTPSATTLTSRSCRSLFRPIIQFRCVPVGNGPGKSETSGTWARQSGRLLRMSTTQTGSNLLSRFTDRSGVWRDFVLSRPSTTLSIAFDTIIQSLREISKDLLIRGGVAVAMSVSSACILSLHFRLTRGRRFTRKLSEDMWTLFSALIVSRVEEGPSLDTMS